VTIAYWFCAAVTLVSALTSAGFSIAGLATATGPARHPSQYAAARSLALAVISVVPLLSPARPWEEAVALAMIVVQALDGVIGAADRDLMKTAGPFSLGAVNALALGLLVTS
jgi:hypothetical protein